MAPRVRGDCRLPAIECQAARIATVVSLRNAAPSGRCAHRLPAANAESGSHGPAPTWRKTPQHHRHRIPPRAGLRRSAREHRVQKSTTTWRHTGQQKPSTRIVIKNAPRFPSDSCVAPVVDAPRCPTQTRIRRKQAVRPWYKHVPSQQACPCVSHKSLPVPLLRIKCP